MKIVHEKVDKESYLEVSLSEKEFDVIRDYMIISKKCLIDEQPLNIGIKLLLDEEEIDDDF